MKKFMSAFLAVILVVASLIPMTSMAANGKFTVTIKGYTQNSPSSYVTIATAYVPYGENTLRLEYQWNASKYQFDLVATKGASYISIPSSAKSINNRNMNGAYLEYTSAKTGSGSATKYFTGGNAIMSKDKKVTINLVKNSKVVANFVVDMSYTSYGEYAVKAETYRSQITQLLTDNSYNPDEFNFNQQVNTQFTYAGCSAVNFTVDGSVIVPSNPVESPAPTTSPVESPVPTTEPVETEYPSDGGKYTVYVKGYAQQSPDDFISLATAFVPNGGNTLKLEYKWNAEKYQFDLVATKGAKYITISSGAAYINNRNMNGVTLEYTSPSTGNGTLTKYLNGSSAITSKDRKLTINLIKDAQVLVAFTADMNYANYGEYTVKAETFRAEIERFLAQNNFAAEDFNFAQQAITKFTYTGCSAVNFSVDGSVLVPVNPVTPTPTAPVDDPTKPVPTETYNGGSGKCLLKIYGSGDNYYAYGYNYKNPFLYHVEPGKNYKLLAPEAYGIVAKEGYKFAYYTANGTTPRAAFTNVYVPAGFSGLTIVAYFEAVEVTNAKTKVEYVDEAGQVVATETLSFSGKYLDKKIITPVAPEGYELIDTNSKTVVIGREETVKFKVKVLPPVVVKLVEVDGAVIRPTANVDVANIQYILVAQGTYYTRNAMQLSSTYTAVRTADKSYTATNLTGRTVFTVYIKLYGEEGKLEYVEVNPIVPQFMAEAGYIKVTANANEVASMEMAKGTAFTNITALRNAPNADSNVDATVGYLIPGGNYKADEFSFVYYVKMSDGGIYYGVISVDDIVEVVGNRVIFNIDVFDFDVVDTAFAAKGEYTDYSAVSTATGNVDVTFGAGTLAGVTAGDAVTVAIKTVDGRYFTINATSVVGE